MNVISKHQKAIFCFLLCLVIFTGSWMSATVYEIRMKGYTDFSVSYIEKINIDSVSVFSSIKNLEKFNAVKQVKLNLKIDYAFMIGIYPLIGLWLLMIRKRIRRWLQVVLLVLAILQIFAFISDAMENYYLLNSIKHITPPFGFSTFQIFVNAKWIIAIAGSAAAFMTCIFKPMVREEITP